MNKLLLSSACIAVACSAFASISAPIATISYKGNASAENNLSKLPKMSKAQKITPTPETKWGEWSDLGTSTVTFPPEEFLYTGTTDNVPTFLRVDENDATHMQYRFDALLPTNTAAEVEPNPLYVDVYGNEVTVYSQQLPPITLGDYDEFYPGPFAICDWAVLYDMESYRMLNQYKANPMSMILNLCIYDESLGESILMGVVDIKLDVKQDFSIPSSCVVGGDMGMGLLKVDADENVWSISYAIVKGDGNTINFETYEYDSIVDRIVNKDESLTIMNWMAGDIMAVPMDGPGVYTLGAVAYGENEEFLSSATCTVFNMQTESWNWTSLGQAKVSEDFLREVFTMNLDNAGIPHDTPVEYEVEIQVSKSKPGLYRLVNLYGPSHPYADIFEYLNDFPVYTYIDCSNPQFCYIYNMPTGFVVKGDTSGEIILGSTPSEYFDKGFPFEMISEEMPEAFGSLSDGTITFTPSQVRLSVPVLKEQLGDDWFEASWFTENNFTIKLPDGSGVNDRSVNAEMGTYYDMNGRRVENPAMGGIYILRYADKAIKVIK